MSSDKFTVTEYLVPACHIREYPGATVQQEDVLKLHVKQYTPKNQPPPPVDAVTIIATHGVGLPKELYEPFWEELLDQAHGFHVRGIWMADFASMGGSGVENEEKLSTVWTVSVPYDDGSCSPANPLSLSLQGSWLDHARDLFLMINHFREQMPRPLVGIGHSFGGNIMTNLAYLHPRLFTTLLLLDPLITISPPAMGFGTDPPGVINHTLWRNDVWPSHESAVRAHRALFRGWDPRCIDRMAQYGFRDLPTALYPDVEAIQARFADANSPNTTAPTPVTLRTTKHHEILAQMRQNFSARSPATGRVEVPRDTHADLDPLVGHLPLYRPETRSTFAALPTLRPSCAWVLGGETFLNLDEIHEGIRICGTGIGGSGGVSEGRVEEVVMPGLGHLMPFQSEKRAMQKVGEVCVEWVRGQMERWRRMEREWGEQRRGKSHVRVEDEWYRVLMPMKGNGKGERKDKL